MGLFSFFQKKPAPIEEVQKQAANTISAIGEDIVRRLETAGYFKYADTSDLLQLKMEIGNELAERQYFPFVANHNPPYNNKDPRHYALDGEELFEQGGVIHSLDEMSAVFEKMNIQMQISDHFEEYDSGDDSLTHRITINGKQYVIFDKFTGYGWGEAAQRYADIVNDQLQLQLSDERLYLICAGNDGRAVFLTDEQFDLLDSLVAGQYEKPLKMTDWCKLNQVEYTKVC